MAKKRKLKYDDLLRELKKGETEPVYFFTREETLLKDKAFKSLKRAVIKKDFEDFNYFVFYGKEVTATTILEELDNPPVESDKKLIIIRNFQSMQFQCKKKIVEYTKNPYQENVLVIETGKVKLNKGIYSQLAKNSQVYYFYHAYNERQAAAFVRKEIRDAGKQISPSAISLIIDSVGLDLLAINNELQKLFLFTKSKNKIALSDVENCVGVTKGNTIFELRENLAEKNLNQSLRIANNMIKNGKTEVFMVIMITRYFKILWRISFMTHKQNRAKSEISKHVPYYNRKDYFRLAKSYNLNDFEAIFDILLETDRKLKSLSLDKKLILEFMIYKICKYE